MFCSNNEASVKDKESARLKLAMMDRLGQGIEQPNYTEAREGFRLFTKAEGPQRQIE